MGNTAAFPRRKDHALQAVRAAIESLRAAGRPVRIDTIAELTGRTTSRTSSQVAQMRRRGQITCEVGKCPRADSAYLRVVAAAEQLRREGGTLTWDRIGRQAGCSAKDACTHACNARRSGRPWPFEVVSKYSLMTSEERSALARQRMAGATRHPWTPESYGGELDQSEVAAIRAEWTALMIDGRGEQDETPPGVVAVSHKDHQHWNEASKRFREATRDDWERPRHRIVDAKGRRMGR